MNRFTAISILVVLGVSLVTTGCDQQKKELQAVRQQYNALQMDKKALEQDLATARATNVDLTAQLDSKNTDLLSMTAERDQWKAKAQDVATRPGPAPAGWQTTATGAKITLSSDILFASGKATLSSRGLAEVRKVAAAIRNTYPTGRVRVYGFTDSDPIRKTKNLWKNNLDLSFNRAMAVTLQLRNAGIADDRIETIGMGKTHPVAPNTSAAGKAKNRRVDVVVIK